MLKEKQVQLFEDAALAGTLPPISILDVAEKKLPPEVKTAQRELFALLYRLLVGSDTGPRIPTLLLSLGPDRVRALLTP